MPRSKFKPGKHFSFQWNDKKSVILGRKGFGKKLNEKSARIFEGYCYKYVPYDKGNLSNRTRVRVYDDHATLTYMMPYAPQIHSGVSPTGHIYHFNPKMHPLATANWEEVCWRNDKYKITADINVARKRLAKK